MADEQPFDVRMRGFRKRADVEDVLALLCRRLQPLPTETVALRHSARRVLAADVKAADDVPAFDRSAMDGYALRGAETFSATLYNPLEFCIIGESRPGRSFTGSAGPGEAVRIMTGAPMPDGADAVLMAEAAEPLSVQSNGCPARIRVTEAVPPGRHVGPKGEDVPAGTTVLKAGRVLRPQDVGLIAALGHADVPVVRRPTVALAITGDELLPAGAHATGHKIVDSNSVMLAALVERDGGVMQDATLVPDRYESVRQALVSHNADVILVSGGSSVGTEDHAPMVLAAEGELAIHGVAMRPASPAGVGFLGNRVVFLLPGNPVSCLAAYDFFAGPAIRRLGGRSMDWPYRKVRLPLRRKITSAIGRVDYVRVLVEQDQVEPIAASGASILSSTTRAAGFVIVPRDSEGVAPGEFVEVYLYDS
jgi:molybdopterin molybdotransferase